MVFYVHVIRVKAIVLRGTPEVADFANVVGYARFIGGVVKTAHRKSRKAVGVRTVTTIISTALELKNFTSDKLPSDRI